MDGGGCCVGGERGTAAAREDSGARDRPAAGDRQTADQCPVLPAQRDHVQCSGRQRQPPELHGRLCHRRGRHAAVRVLSGCGAPQACVPAWLEISPLLFPSVFSSRNPCGRTGMRERGLLGRYGPNHAADPVVTRWARSADGSFALVGPLVGEREGGITVCAVFHFLRQNWCWTTAGRRWAAPGRVCLHQAQRHGRVGHSRRKRVLREGSKRGQQMALALRR